MGLLEEIVYYLSGSENRAHIWQFLLGILEGDGCIGGGKNRFGISFAFQRDDEIIRELLSTLGIKYSVDTSRLNRGEGLGAYATFWLFEVLLNLLKLSDKLFCYYPKRRQTFIERLLKQRTVQRIMDGEKPGLFLSSIGEKEVDFSELQIILSKLQKELNSH
jgi:hypothetical protein